MKKFLLLCFALCLFSCTPDTNDDDDRDDDNSDNKNISNTRGTLLKSEKKISSSGYTVWTKNYEYDANGNISKLTATTWYDEISIRTFNYDSNNKLISYHEDVTDAFGDESEYYFYPEYTNGNIVSTCIEHIHDDSYHDTIDKINYVYDSNNFITSFIFFDDRQLEYFTCSDLSDISTTKTASYDVNGNIIRSQNSDDSYLLYEYDDKNHPYANIKPKGFMNNMLASSTVNNQTLVAQYYTETDIKSGGNFYDYTYNIDGFPTEKRETFTSSLGTVKYQYTYY